MDRKPPAHLNAGARFGEVVQVGRGLNHEARLVSDEDIRRDDLDHRAVWMAPLALRTQHEHRTQTAFADRGLLTIRIGQAKRSIRLALKMQRHINRGGNHEMTPVEVDGRGAMLDRF